MMLSSRSLEGGGILVLTGSETLRETRKEANFAELCNIPPGDFRHMPPVVAALEALSRRVHEELALFEYPTKDWVTPRRGPHNQAAQNVVIIGGGQTGLGIAFGLQRERISGVVVLDASPAGEEGPWITFARMITLRTLKFLTGPDLGVPGLTFRAWHEAQYGKQSWNELARIHKDEWMRYLVWFRHTLGLPVRNNVQLERIEPRGGLLALHLSGGETMLTRKLVLATGIEGSGARRVPAFVCDKLPRSVWIHTSDDRDFAALAGQRVAVMGGGASAFDNAASALEAGAARVDLFMRRPELPVANSYRALESAGFWRNFGDMPDAQRWRFMCHLLSLPMPPPQDTLQRTLAHANVALHFSSPVLDAETTVDGIRLRTPKGWHAADFLILGTGFGVDLRLRQEFAGVAEHVATWGDRYTPPAGDEDAAAALYPYVGPHFELHEKRPGSLPALRNIHLFNAGSLVSMGPVAGGLNGMPFGIPRLIAGLSRDLFHEELDSLFTEFSRYDEPDAWEVVRAGGSGGN
jgi:cation diffusion facilitator CzcD-associated flavoprotein CzcO